MQKLTSPFDLIKKAVNIFTKKENLVFLIQIYMPMAFFSLLSVIQSFLPASVKNSTSIWLVSGVVLIQILYFLTSVLVTISGVIALGKIVNGKEELSVRKTYKSARKNYFQLVYLMLILAVIYILGFALLIIPGILFVVWFAFSRFIAIEKGLKVKEALLKSKAMVKGIYWKVLGRLVVFCAFTVLIQMVLSIIPYGLGLTISSLCGGLYMLPLYLLYKELDVV